MSFMALVIKNLFRQRVRTVLTVLGISIGITTVVALGVVTSGMKATMTEIMHAGGSDFMVAQAGSADLTFSILTDEQWAAIGAQDGVAWAHGTLLHITPIGRNPYFVLSGVRPEDIAESPPELLAGRLFDPGAADEVLLGEGAADDLQVTVDAIVELDDRLFRVVGVYRTGTIWQDNGAYAPLQTVQAMAGKPGMVTAVYVQVHPDASRDAVAARIEATVPNAATITSLADYGEVDQGAQLVDALNAPGRDRRGP
jgi:putative ABC transport system permease protein